jgi:undecaprenyl pyrophosphate synthase
VARGETSVEQIDERLVSDRLLTAYVCVSIRTFGTTKVSLLTLAILLLVERGRSGQPDPDLLIRTSGELRLSNFLLYQAAYSELVFLDKLWPELSQQDLHEVIREFSRRKRRFGK